jgi:hypothetical protein
MLGAERRSVVGTRGPTLRCLGQIACSSDWMLGGYVARLSRGLAARAQLPAARALMARRRMVVQRSLRWIARRQAVWASVIGGTSDASRKPSNHSNSAARAVRAPVRVKNMLAG